jgi:hypothetical protein
MRRVLTLSTSLSDCLIWSGIAVLRRLRLRTTTPERQTTVAAGDCPRFECLCVGRRFGGPAPLIEAAPHKTLAAASQSCAAAELDPQQGSPMSIRIASLAAAALFAVLQLAPLLAQKAPLSLKADFSARLIVGEFERTDPAAAWLGLDVRLGPGWHTYWRSPGDAGAPPEFDWSDSRNVAKTTIEWPAPHRFSDDGIDTFGYAEHVLFPVKVRLRDESAPAHVSLKLVLFVCSTICTQNESRLVADITPGFGRADAQRLISEWRSKPRTAPR